MLGGDWACCPNSAHDSTLYLSRRDLYFTCRELLLSRQGKTRMLLAGEQPESLRLMKYTFAFRAYFKLLLVLVADGHTFYSGLIYYFAVLGLSHLGNCLIFHTLFTKSTGSKSLSFVPTSSLTKL